MIDTEVLLVFLIMICTGFLLYIQEYEIAKVILFFNIFCQSVLITQRLDRL